MSLNPIKDPILLSENDILLAKNSSSKLEPFLNKSLTFTIANKKENIKLPSVAVNLLVDVLSQISKGNAVTVLPIHSELTTAQAAEILRVSRPFLIKQLENNAIPFRKVGKHRRILLSDLMLYKHTIDKRRLSTLAKLSEQAQELDMGY